MIEYTEEIIEKINTLYKYDNKFRERLLKKDNDAITELAKYGQSSFSPNEILDYINEGNIMGLKAEAERRKMARDIYFSIIGKKDDVKGRKM